MNDQTPQTLRVCCALRETRSLRVRGIRWILGCVGLCALAGCFSTGGELGNPLGRRKAYIWQSTSAAREQAQTPVVVPQSLAWGEPAQAPAQASQTTPAPATAPTHAEDAQNGAAPGAATPQAPPPVPKFPKVLPRIELPPPYQKGEVLDFDVAWSFVHAGSATLTADRGRVDNKELWRYSMNLKTTGATALFYKMDDLMHSYVNSKSFQVFRTEFKQDEGGRREDTWYLFDYPQGQVKEVEKRYKKQGISLKEHLTFIPLNVQDPLSSLFYARAWALRPGRELRWPVYVSRQIIEIKVEVGDVEQLKTAVGELAAHRVRVSAMIQHKRLKDKEPHERFFWIWYTADERKIPVRMEIELPFGSIKFTLRRYVEGAS